MAALLISGTTVASRAAEAAALKVYGYSADGRYFALGVLVKECAKYLEQPVIKQLIVSECQLAAYRYGSALPFLKAEYRK